MKGIIYKYTSPSGKCYIGQTINEDRRKLQHKRAAFNENHKEYDKPFYRAASEITDADSSGIIAACRGKQKSAGGYQWRYGFSEKSIPPVSYKEPARTRKFGKDNPRSKPVHLGL